MTDDFVQLLRAYPPWQVVIELTVIWVCVYLFFRAFRGTRGGPVIHTLAVLLILLTFLVHLAGRQMDAFARLSYIYDRAIFLVAVALIVVFQPELRQALIRLTHLRPFRAAGAIGMEGVIDSVTEATIFLARNQFGAIIAIERNVMLNSLIGNGQIIDAEVSARLLETIFWPNSPLHDLGVVIRGNRILAAGVQFPLAEDGLLPPSTGSRHRAALGLAMESDSLVIIVSEETGAISIAENGAIEFDVPREHLAEALHQRLSTPPRESLPPEPIRLDSSANERLDQEKVVA